MISNEYVSDISDMVILHCMEVTIKDDINISTIIPIIKMKIYDYLQNKTIKSFKKIIELNDGIYTCFKIYNGDKSIDDLINDTERRFYITILNNIIFTNDFHTNQIKVLVDKVLSSYDNSNEQYDSIEDDDTD